MPDAVDQRIADLVVERIPDRACVQVGIGSIPNGILTALAGHRDLGIHTELLSDGVIDLIESGVVTGVYKVRRPGQGRRAPSRLALDASTTSWTSTRPSSCSRSTG